MRPSDVLRLVAGALVGHRLRVSLTLGGVGIGISAVVLLIALGEGARRYVVEGFASLGTNLLIVVPGHTETTGGIPGIGGTPNDLTIEDAEHLARRMGELDLVTPVVVGEEDVSRGERSRRALVMGSTSEMAAIRGLRVTSGRFLPAGPWERGSPVAVLGAKLARELFPGGSAVGGSVRIGGWRMRVVGVLAGRGTHLGIDLDQAVFVPVATAMRMFDRSSLFRVVMTTRSHEELDLAAERVRAELVERHGEEDVTVLTQDAVVGSLSSILAALTLAVAGIGAVSLVVAGIGIMNVMLVTVSERTREVGLMKALGASRRQVLVLVVGEAALISSAGGAIGLVLGWAAAAAVPLGLEGFRPEPPVWAVVAAAALSVVLGAVFGLLPARRAMRLDPIAALARR